MSTFYTRYPTTGGGGGGTVTSVTATSPLASSGGTTPDISLSGVVNIAHGGTNSSTALNNNRIIISSGGAIIEQSALTASRALVTDSSGLPVVSATTATEIGYVSGVTSSIQTQLNSKLSSPVNLATQVTGTLPIANGGTNATSFTSNKLVYYNGTSFVSQAASAVATSGNLLTLTAQASTDTPFLIKGAASQSADLFTVQNSSGTNLGSFTKDTQFYLGSVTPFRTDPGFYVGCPSGDCILGLQSNTAIIKLQTDGINTYFGSQSNHSFAFLVNNTPIAGFNTNSQFGVGVTGASIAAKCDFRNGDPNVPTLITRAATAQVANTQEWQNVSGTVLSYVDATGHMVNAAGLSAGYAKVGGSIFYSTTQTGNSGSSETDLFSSSIAASTLGTNGDSIEFYAAGTFAATANNKQVRVKFGGTTVLDTGALVVTTASSWRVTGSIIRTGATSQKAIVSYFSSDATLLETTSYTTPGETLSGAVTLKVTGQATSNNDIVGEMWKGQWSSAS